MMEARKLRLPQTFPLSSPDISSLLFDPYSLSLALAHSDSSFSLYPSLSPFSLSCLPPPQTVIPPPTSSATFLRLQNPNPSSNPRVLFVAASPFRGGAAILLRFWILAQASQSFTRARLVCNQKGLELDQSKLGTVLSVNHGVSIKLVGSINVFALYSVSNGKIWVFAVKMLDGDDSGTSLKLMKRAVIDCLKPMFAISVSFGFLILGEENGVRVFPLRPLVKGRMKKVGREKKSSENGSKNEKLEDGRMKLPNGVISSNGYVEGRSQKHFDSVKLRSVNLKQDSKEYGAYFVAFRTKEIESYKHAKELLQSAKASVIQALSHDKFLILDSAGDLHLLCMSNRSIASEIPFQMKWLPNTMKVQKLAFLPDDLMTRSQYVWISDGQYTIHAIALPGAEVSVDGSSGKNFEEKLVMSSVNRAIFISEKIQEIVPLTTNAVLILGQGSLFAYAIS